MPGKLSKMGMPERKSKAPSDAEFDAEFDMESEMDDMAEMGEAEMPEMAPEDDLTAISDEALMAEIRKRGLSAELGEEMPEMEPEEEDEMAEFEMSEDEMEMEMPAPAPSRKSGRRA